MIFASTGFYDSLKREHSSNTYDWKRVKVIYGSILYFVESLCLVLSVVRYHLLQYSLYAKGKYWFFFEETLWLHHQYRFIYWCNILLQGEHLTWCQFEVYIERTHVPYFIQTCNTFNTKEDNYKQPQIVINTSPTLHLI